MLSCLSIGSFIPFWLIKIVVLPLLNWEVLGYPNLSLSKIEQFEICFDNLNIISIDSLIIEKAILLRQQNKIKAGDALIAATAPDLSAFKIYKV